MLNISTNILEKHLAKSNTPLSLLRRPKYKYTNELIGILSLLLTLEENILFSLNFFRFTPLTEPKPNTKDLFKFKTFSFRIWGVFREI